MFGEGNGLKVFAIALLAIAAAVFAYYFYGMQEESLSLGSEVNMATFSSILADSKNVFIVMDVRYAEEGAVKTNILQCGVDFAGSPGLAGKNLTFFSIDKGGSCIGMNSTFSTSQCFKEMGRGLTIFVQEGNSTKFYTNAMVVGVGSDYPANGCNIGVKKQ